MSAFNRLPAPMGLLIDRSQPLSFSFEGERYQGFAGDSIASALLANQRWLLSRSFKYHRPRGPLSMAGQDANTLVQLPSEPNVLADAHPLSAELQVTGQNYAGSLDNDRDALLGKFSKFMPVGFYYRSFYKPKGIWKVWEPLIRRKAGLGVLDLKFQPEYHDKAFLFVDVAVVGAGPAGLQAALDAADAGARVLLIEQQPVLGGSLNWARFDVDPLLRRDCASDWSRRSKPIPISRCSPMRCATPGSPTTTCRSFRAHGCTRCALASASSPPAPSTSR